MACEASVRGLQLPAMRGCPGPSGPPKLCPVRPAARPAAVALVQRDVQRPAPHGPPGDDRPPAPGAGSLSRNKDAGTWAETQVVRLYIAAGWAGAERRALRGLGDAGDIAGIPDFCTQVKNVAALRLETWFDEVLKQQQNAGASGCLLVVRKKYKPVAKWDAWMPYAQLCPSAATLPEGVTPWVRMDLDLAQAWMKAAGY